MNCCLTIQTGGLIVASIDVVLNIIGILLSSTLLLFQICLQFNCKLPIANTVPEQKHRQVLASIESVFWSLIFFMFLCIKQIVFNSLLIHGIRKNDLRKLRIWLVFKACIVILGIFMILTQDSIGQGAHRQISEILYVFLTLFFMCIIFILYDVMYRRRHANRLVNTS